MTLWDLKQGTSATVQSFVSSLESSYRTRLSELGFHPGELISCVLSPSLGAPKLYRVNNSVYSLDDSVASLIKVGSSVGKSTGTSVGSMAGSLAGTGE
jgi:Fe2+ transport system protein FeoA